MFSYVTPTQLHSQAVATKLFLSDLKYTCLTKDNQLAQFKAIVKFFDPSNKKLMSLDAICKSIECCPEDEIKNEYENLMKNFNQSSQEQEEKTSLGM